jgi:pyruvate dehydrogenase (quinone)
LEKAGVRRVYGLPGESVNGFTDALRRNGVSAFLPEDIFTGS